MHERDPGRAIRGLTARQIETWRAWYDLEPRDEERADWQAALGALMHAKEGTTLVEMVRMLRDHWMPVSKAEAKRRRIEKRRKWQSRLNEYGKGLQEEKVKRGRK